MASAASVSAQGLLQRDAALCQAISAASGRTGRLVITNHVSTAALVVLPEIRSAARGCRKLGTIAVGFPIPSRPQQ